MPCASNLPAGSSRGDRLHRPMTDEAQRPDDDGEPDLTRITAGLHGPIGAIAIASVGLLFLATFYTLYFGREFFLPIAIAVLLKFLLTPPVRALKRLGIAAPIGAGVILVLFFGAVGYGTYRVWTPAMDWVERAPETLADAEVKLRSIREPVERLREAGEQVEALARGQEARTGESSDDEGPSLDEKFLQRAQDFVVGGTVAAFLLYFLLAMDDLFLRKLAGVLPHMSQRRKAVVIVREIEQDLSRYVLVRTLINVGFGAAVGGALWLLGMPNPVLWGVVAGVLNYVPYLGGLIGYAIVGLVAMTTFDTTGQALLAPGAYFVLNVIEGNIVTPAVLGRELTLNPVMIFVWLIFWTWIWGIPGSLLAIPLLAMTKIVADNIETLSPVGAFLGR